MKTKVNKIFFLIPVAYAAVIIFLLYMQFSGSGSFYSEVSGISISGKIRSSTPGNGKVITDLAIRSSGMYFTFGEENPALIFSQDGLTHRTIPQDYRVTASGIDIRLSKGLNVSFYRRPNDDVSLYITVSVEDPESIKSISIPAFGDGAEIKPVDGVPVISVKSEIMGSFFLTLPETGSYDTKTSSIVIYPETGKAAELVLEKTAGSGFDAYTYWLNSGAEPVSAEDLDKEIKTFIAKATRGLIGPRFNSTRGTWSMGTGVSSFDENALVMAATEIIGTSSYRDTLEKLNQAAASHSKNLTMLSSAFFGNIVNEGWAYEQTMLDKVKEYEELAGDDDYSIFSSPDLITAILTEDSDKLIKNISAMSKTASESVTDINSAVDMLTFYNMINETYPALAGKLEGITALTDKLIVPHIKIAGDRPYLIDDEGKSDIENTLRAGLILMRTSNNGKAEHLRAMGMELVRSALLLSDDSGIMPATLITSDNTVATEEGFLTPETVYPFLTDNPYFPAADYFYDETGEKISVLNQAEIFNIEKTDFGYRMTFNFPAGQTHMFAVRNIKPFYQMHMLGYRWNSDHRFLSYSSGWWFDRQHNTLFVKIKHRMKTEEILIYTEPPQPEPEPEPAEDATETGDETVAPVSSGQPE